jgi:hypothetical protein
MAKKKMISKDEANRCASVIKNYAIQEAKKSAKKGAKEGSKLAKKGARATAKAAKSVAKKGFSKLKSLFK